MRLIDLVVAIGADVYESSEKIQICHPGKKLGRLR